MDHATRVLARKLEADIRHVVIFLLHHDSSDVGQADTLVELIFILFEDVVRFGVVQ